jgi:hypothetical protein
MAREEIEELSQRLNVKHNKAPTLPTLTAGWLAYLNLQKRTTLGGNSRTCSEETEEGRGSVVVTNLLVSAR